MSAIEAGNALAVGERLFHTVEHGDLDELRAIFAEGATVWHNTDEKETDVETTIANLARIRASASVFRYVDIEREPTPSGFVQRHTLLIEMPDGRAVRDLACCVCRVEGGRLAHMAAYHDSAVTSGMAHKQPDA